ncbi:bifunctional 4-hydroxy-2-oxoglutarate aldolase/2-dehydro-3-deoxy-phosphogluconate aldolase [Frankia sp. Cr2]|uniref:bifunctional 4-hydroxy-2-oxoglutarate aldolase/2-dehydro-3-deoxy-phosphogluconate aldolase n=1 Tax=Frankia sp. Cr2 TaxID=3073932 RepID=UPI002AD2A2DD|nr:bifunctional 4-hydroxy-2-oxoglutarate aldolase/2-dehydro-3-deoxy-phosphogluconate aldolase [Frankia sp. Cr2]
MTTITQPLSLFDVAPVVPVVVLNDIQTAVLLARALVTGGLPIIEVTLRTETALQSIKKIAAEVPEALVGAGTVITVDQVKQAVDAGARFLVSPGCTARLLDTMDASGLPYLPGVATASEMLGVLDRGRTEMKFFPAEAAGGVAYLKAVAGPLPQIRFCPTGGITIATAQDYLALPNVGCVGGSWLTPPDAVAAGDWTRISNLARAAASLSTPDVTVHL